MAEYEIGELKVSTALGEQIPHIHPVKLSISGGSTEMRAGLIRSILDAIGNVGYRKVATGDNDISTSINLIPEPVAGKDAVNQTSLYAKLNRAILSYQQDLHDRFRAQTTALGR